MGRRIWKKVEQNGETPLHERYIYRTYLQIAELDLLTTAYTPFGKVTAEGESDQPIQWSSDFNDSDLGLVYYNYRCYNPTDGRWTRRDAIFPSFYFNEYTYYKSCS